jgi:tetratricopeptide (TPR) repeat protein
MSDMPENKENRVELINKGIAYLDRALAINSKYVNGYYNRALAYNSLSQWDKQLSNLDSVKKYKPDYPGLADQYLYLYHDKGLDCWKSKKYDEAIAAYQQGCKLSPQDPEMWYMLGITYYSIKDYAAAIKAWDVTLKLNPNHQGAKSSYPVALRFIGSAGGK